MTAPALPLESVRDRTRVGALMAHPLRLAILQAASAPHSATEIAAGLGVPRQRVNYHVDRLRRAGFLVPAGRRKRRGLYEQRYTASAQAYVLDPGVLGSLSARAEHIADRLSGEYLVALSSQMQSELGQVMTEANQEGKRVATMSLSTDIRFTSPEQRARFAYALQKVVTRLVARHTAPAQADDGQPLPGRLFRLVVGCYPPPTTPRRGR
jgi:biotin operon repressor